MTGSKTPLATALLAFLLGASAVGCAGAKDGKDVVYPSSGSSPYSASAPYSAPSQPGVPARESVTSGLVVRPDQLCVPFAVHVLDADADHGVSVAQAAIGEVTARLRAAAGGAGVVRMRGIAIAPAIAHQQKKVDEPEHTVIAVVSDGTLEIPLTGADYWARSRLVAALVAASKIESDARAMSTAKVTFELPQMKVADPEVHRAKLTKAWVERARSFADAASTPGAPLVLADCAIPGDITQRHVSTEEVALTLTIGCRLDATGAAAK